MTEFGTALRLLRHGRLVTRRAWAASNPAPPWLVLVPGSTITVDPDRPLGRAAPELAGEPVSYAPHIDIVTNAGGQRTLQPWVPTSGDLLAVDWVEAV